MTSADINSICQQRLFRAATALQADEGVGVAFIGSGLLGIGLRVYYKGFLNPNILRFCDQGLYTCLGMRCNASGLAFAF